MSTVAEFSDEEQEEAKRHDSIYGQSENNDLRLVEDDWRKFDRIKEPLSSYHASVVWLGDIEGALSDFATCIGYSPLSAPCAENFVVVLAGEGRDIEAFAHFTRMLETGMVKAREADLSLLARMGEKTAFMVLSNDSQVLYGWNEHEKLYNALRSTENDHSQLVHSLTTFSATNPDASSYTVPIVLAYIDSSSVLLDSFIIWNKAHRRMRQTDQFRDFIRRTGILKYWQQQGFPPQCRPLGSNDFDCD